MQACQRFWHSRYCGLTGVLQRNVCPPDGLFVWVSLILLKYLKCSLFMGISTHYQLLAGGGQLQPSKCEPLPMNSWHERGGGRQGGERGACVCIVPLQGSRCCGPHSGEDPGCMAGSGGGRQGATEVRKGPWGHLEPFTATDLLPWVIQEKHARHRPSPSAPPPQGEDIINYRHRTHQGATMPSLASLFMCSPGGKWPRAVLGQTCGQVPGDAGSRVHCVS